MSNRKKFQFVFVHDHTASMGGLRVQVRKKNCEAIEQLFGVITNADVEVGVLTICDRHDVHGERDMKELLITGDKNAVIRYIQTVPDALGNSSWEECYERAFHRLREFNWDKDAIKIVIFTGDSEPHPQIHFKNPERFNWRTELTACIDELGLKFYPVYALTFTEQSRRFWEDFGSVVKSPVFRLDQFDHITPLLLGIAAREGGVFDAWEANYTKSQGSSIPYAVQRAMDQLAGRAPRTYSSRNSGKALASDARFQVYSMEEDTRVPAFFKELGIIEREDQYNDHKGELFYAHEVRASETIRPNHEVIVEDDKTGEKIYGADARALIGIPYGTKDQKLKKNPLKSQGYTVWVQSKSVGNARILDKGIRVMIDLDPKAGFGTRV